MQFGLKKEEIDVTNKKFKELVVTILQYHQYTDITQVGSGKFGIVYRVKSPD